MTTVQQRLILIPKAPTPLGAVSLRPEIARLVDPNPDFDLLDIRLELEEIEAKYAAKSWTSSSSRAVDTALSAPTGGKRFGGDVSDVADFGRGGFRMRLSDSGLYSDDSDEERNENAYRHIDFKRGDHQRQEFTAPRGVDVGRLQPDWLKSPILPKTDEVETALREVNHKRLLKVQEDIKQTLVSFEKKFKEEQQQSAARFIQLEKDEVAKHEKARRNDKQDQRLIAEARDQHLSVLQRDHEQRSQVEERAIRKEAAAEDARRRERERVQEQQRKAWEETEAEARRKAEVEREKAADEAAKRKAQADAAAAAALQRAEVERKAKVEAERKAIVVASKEAAKAAAASVPKPRVSEQAAIFEDARLNKLKELQESYLQLAEDPALKQVFKGYERQLIKHLQQVSATQEQVRKKSADLLQLFQSPNGPPIQFLIVTLGAKILSQCESQVQKLPSFAFALAQVVVNVASQVPLVMESMLAQLNQVCIFTVPKYYIFSKTQFGNDDAYYKALGYKVEGGKLESTDDYVARMNAYMTFYAALTQTEVGGGGANPHGLGDAWSWCSRLLNRIPANRLSASALESFLKTAGFRLFQAFPKPFMKLMQAVVSEFLVSLKNHEDADAKAVVYRLETYLHTGQFNSPPDGRNMPLRDISSQIRA